MRIAITGDVMLGRLVDQYIIRNPDIDPGYVWGDCLPLFHDAHLRLINLECVIADFGQPWKPLTKAFRFRANPRAIEALKTAKIDFVSLANNHSLDYGAEALEECVELLDRAGIAHAGAGKNKVDAQEPVVLERDGRKLAIISITDNEPSWEAKGSDHGVFYVDYAPDGLREPYRSYVKQAVEKAKKSSDILVASAHVGPNWGPPSPAIRALAHELIEMGADCYWGHSNHTPQAVEVYGGKPVLYSTGDFIDDYAVDRVKRNDLSSLFLLDWQNAGWKLTLYPTKIEGFQVNRVYGKEASYVINRMERLSQTFNTGIRRKGDMLIVIPQ